MTHPHLLHLRASSWSLNAARGALHVRAGEEAEQIAAEVAEGVNDGVRSSVFGQFGGTGHGDPVAAVALAGSREPRDNVYERRERLTLATLDYLANHPDVNAQGPGDPLPRIMAATHRLRPTVAEVVWRELRDEDQRVRNLLPDLRPHLAPLDALVSPAPPCPACRMVTLYVQTAAPSHLWTVICRAECVCSGVGCRCDMPIKVEGVPHIWDRNAPFVTTALTTARRPR